MYKRFFVTIVVSTLLGVIFGTITSFVQLNFSDKKDEPIPYIQIAQPIVLAGRSDCCSIYENKEDKGQEIIYFEKKEEKLQKLEPQIIPSPLVTTNSYESTTSGQLQSEVFEPLPTPTNLPTESAAPQPSLDADLIFALVNEKRVKLGLPAFEKDIKICEVAKSRVPELNDEMLQGQMHRGFYGRRLPYRAAENVIYIKTEQQAVNWWLSSRVHKGQLLGNYKYSCVACGGQACTQLFSNYTPN